MTFINTKIVLNMYRISIYLSSISAYTARAKIIQRTDIVFLRYPTHVTVQSDVVVK
jgi:hypothetical protein